jgi:CrcB protein
MVTSLLVVGGIGLAGACGAVARYLLGRFVAQRLLSPFPLGTLLINVLGAFFIGIVFVLATRHLVSSGAQAVLATGFLGGFTTFSTMQWEAVQLLRGGNMRQSALYLGATVVIGFGAVFLGMALGWWV